MPETIVVIPTYNERENIQELSSALLALPVNLGLVIVDDNSPDGTGQLADSLCALHPGLVMVVHRAGKLGLGTAYLAGFRQALSQPDVKRIMTMDADFSHPPKVIPDLIALSESYDLVIGSRYVAGGATPDFPIWRRVLSWGANAFARLMLGLKARDATAGFRCYRRAVLETIPLDSIFSSGYSFLIEMLFLVQQAGFSVGEVPIVFMDRERGASKISRQEIARAMYTVLRLASRRFLKTG